ncbi:MAG: ABC transporter ATP-binding protein [bacterium]|nr:ABC transporter ATP-binding protein [Candidatus Microgenomates bacterium CPR3]MCQ3944459.1 ABC transporter ATP-binding protein [bacterium]RIK51782.1 MAG: ABC transporter [Candidatus Microgenomates bacterium]
MSVLEVNNLTKTFKQSPIIKGISFDVAEGEILGILGPNGAGKTTTLQMLLGILTPTSGSIKIFGQDIATHKSEILESVNFSSTYVDMPWRLSVKENLTWSSYLYQITDRKKRLKQVMELFRLEKIWNMPVASLSAGQKTRVNLARSMVNYPRLLLLDEPTASLDPEVASYMREFFAKQRATYNKSIILTSHNMAEVEELCDRVLILKDGLIFDIDTPANLAKKIEDCYLNLRITKNDSKLDELLRRRKLTSTVLDGVTRIEIKEKILPLFLYELTKLNIQYSEINIDKPNLEDYFMKVAKEKTV